jgi:hypothetical protein
MNPTGRRPFLASIIAGLSNLSIAARAAQLASGQIYAPKQSDRQETATGDEPGFTPMFDGKELYAWLKTITQVVPFLRQSKGDDVRTSCNGYVLLSLGDVCHRRSFP